MPKYGKKAGEEVEKAMKERKKGELKSGSGKKVKSKKQAIAIGLSKARRGGVKLKTPKNVSEKTRKSATYASEAAKKHKPVSRTRSRARVKALKGEPRASVSPAALSRQAHIAATHRSAASRSRAAKKAVATKGHSALSAAAKKAARTRARSH